MTVPNHQAPRGKHIGVLHAPSQAGTKEERATGQKNALVSFAPGQMYAVEYTDEQGIKQDPVVIFEAGGVFYMPPNASGWAKELKPLADWLQTACKRRLAAAKAVEGPTKAVDVLGED